MAPGVPIPLDGKIGKTQANNQTKIILIKNGELVLKGLNRNTFEDILIKNMRKALAEIGADENIIVMDNIC